VTRRLHTGFTTGGSSGQIILSVSHESVFRGWCWEQISSWRVFRSSHARIDRKDGARDQSRFRQRRSGSVSVELTLTRYDDSAFKPRAGKLRWVS
jgi:hypothetical protein